MTPARTSYDVVIVGGGHNGLVAAAYVARAGRTVLVLERQDHTGGAAVSEQVFAGVDARLSRFSYLVSLLPDSIIRDLGLRFETRKRRISSYTPVGTGGLLVDNGSEAATRESFTHVTGSDRDFVAWQRFYGRTAELARRVFPTLTAPLPTRSQLRGIVADDALWDAVFERPLGDTVDATFADDTVRGVVLTDALIGTFTHAHDESLLQNRCFLYHVIGGGTGDWDVPVGGMGALTDALAAAARAAGAEISTGRTVTGIDTDGASAEVTFEGGAVAARHVLVNAAPYELGRLLGEPVAKPEGAQLKINMLLRRLPALKDKSVDARDAFAGTFHVAESATQLDQAYLEAVSGRIPSAPPSEIYCHTLTDPSILSPELIAQGMHTLTLFGLHAPARLFEKDPAGTKAIFTDVTLAQLDAVLAEPIRDCLAVDANGVPCLEAKSPLDLEQEIGMPGGHIFHRDLEFPYRADDSDADDAAARWGVATAHRNIFLCGAGAVRGGGVSGIGGHNAAMAVLETD